MPLVDLDFVCTEHGAHLPQYRSTRHLDTVSLEDRIDVIGINVVFLEDAFLRAGTELPQTLEVGPICGELYPKTSVAFKHEWTIHQP